MPTATIPLVFFTSFGVGFSGAVSPGPLLAYNIREAVSRGFIAGPLVAGGHAILELAVVSGLALGVSRFLEGGPALAVIGLLGGLFLLWMGWGMVRSPARYVQSEDNTLSEATERGWPVLGGVLVSLSNPFWSIWWLTIGLSYLVWSRDLGFAGVTSFYLGHILSDLVWYSLVSFAVASGRRFLGPAVYKGLMAGCGLFLLAMGGYFIASGIGSLAE